MKGAQALIGTLTRSGVDTCFLNPGTSETHFVAALDYVPEMRGILCLFEGVASAAADGYARMAKKPAATLLHLGPGLGNAWANLHNAKKARSPLVNIVGDHASYHLQYDTPLTSDIAALAAPVSDWVHSSQSADELGRDTARAVAAAMRGAGQIATLILPADSSWNDSSSGFGEFKAPEGLSQVPSKRLEHIAQLLGNGKSTTLMLGENALSEKGLHAAHRIAAKTGAELLAPTFNSRIDQGAGHYPIPRLRYIPEMAREQLDGAQQLILVCSHEPASFFAYPGLSSLSTPKDCVIERLSESEEDGALALEALAELLNCPKDPATQMQRVELAAPKGALNPFAVWQSIGCLLPDNAIFVNESATASFAQGTSLSGAASHSYLDITGGSIGWAVPASIGAAIACPDRPVICAQGDGGAMYTLQALWTQAREKLDITTIIFSNKRYQILQLEMARTGAEGGGERAMAMFDLSRPDLDWVKLSEAQGVPARRVASAEQFHAALSDALKEPGPHLIDVPGPTLE